MEPKLQMPNFDGPLEVHEEDGRVVITREGQIVAAMPLSAWKWLQEEKARRAKEAKEGTKPADSILELPPDLPRKWISYLPWTIDPSADKDPC